MNAEFQGTPSDQAAEILATGNGDIGSLFVSMAEKHPQGADAGYLRWHTLDHRPEQQRLTQIKTSLRLVSTPACRAARAASESRFDLVDHVMTYFFSEPSGLEPFSDLSTALRSAGRSPYILPPVQRGLYAVSGKVAAPRVKVGADVLPWRPVRGVYVLLEKACADVNALLKVDGVAGVWSAVSVPNQFSNADAGLQLSYCFLDAEPVETAEKMQAVLHGRWNTLGIRALLAAPFFAVAPYDWDCYLP